MNSLVEELVNVTAKEKASLGQCKNFLSMLAAMQVNPSAAAAKTELSFFFFAY